MYLLCLLEISSFDLYYLYGLNNAIKVLKTAREGGPIRITSNQ